MPILKSSARIATLLSGIFMGFVGLFVKALSIIPTFAIVSLRGLFASLVLLIYFLFSHRIRVIGILFRVSPFYLIAQSLCGVGTIFFYFVTIQNAGYAFAAFMLYIGPILTVLLVWLFYKRRPTKKSIIAFGMAILGVFFLMNLWQWTGILSPGYFWLSTGSGLLSGLCLGIMSTFKVAFFEKLKTFPEKNIDPISLYFGMAFFNVIMLFLIFGPFSIQYYPIASGVSRSSTWG